MPHDLPHTVAEAERHHGLDEALRGPPIARARAADPGQIADSGGISTAHSL